MLAAGILNHVANDPDVLRSVAPGLSVLDLSSFFEQPGNLMFGDFDGVVLFTPLAEDESYYEMHLMFTERRRGKALLTQTRSAITSMFTEHGASIICGRVPRENRPSRLVACALGFRPSGTISDCFGRACVVYVLERAQWNLFLLSPPLSSEASVH